MPMRSIRRRSSRRVRSRRPGSRFESGSSRSSTLGAGARARASATRCCWPPDSALTARRSSPDQLDHGQGLRHPPVPLESGEPAALQAERDIAANVEVRKESIVLEHHPEPARRRRHARHILPIHDDAALIGSFESGQQTKGGGLAAAAGTEQGKDVAPRDGQGKAVHCRHAPETLGEALEPEVGRSEPRLPAAAHRSLATLAGVSDPLIPIGHPRRAIPRQQLPIHVRLVHSPLDIRHPDREGIGRQIAPCREAIDDAGPPGGGLRPLRPNR